MNLRALAVSCLFSCGPVDALAQQVTILEQTHETLVNVLGDAVFESADTNSFFSDVSFENEIQYDPCESDPDNFCHEFPWRTASGRGRARQESTLSPTTFQLTGNADAFLSFHSEPAYPWYQTSSVSRSTIHLEVNAPTRITIQGDVALDANSQREWSEMSGAQTVLSLKSQEQTILGQSVRCYDVQYRPDVQCPERPIEFHYDTVLVSGTYTLEALATASTKLSDSAAGDSHQAAASYDYVVTFSDAHVGVRAAPWSAIKKLYR